LCGLLAEIGLLFVRTWLEQQLEHPNFGYGTYPSSNRRERLWPMGILRWSTLSKEVHDFLFTQNNRNRIHLWIDEDLFYPFIGDTKARSNAVITLLLPLLLKVMFGLDVVGIVLEDVIRAELSHEYEMGRLGKVQFHMDSLAFAYAQVEDIRQELDIGLLDRIGRKFFIIEMKWCLLLRTNSRGDLPSLHEVDSFLRTGHARDRSIVEAVAYMVAKGIGYDALSIADVMYFVKFTRENRLFISDGVVWEDPSYLWILAYVIHLGRTNTTSYSIFPTRHVNGSNSPSTLVLRHRKGLNESKALELGHSATESGSRSTRRTVSADFGSFHHMRYMVQCCILWTFSSSLF
jgi:hypothetical protein